MRYMYADMRTHYTLVAGDRPACPHWSAWWRRLFRRGAPCRKCEAIGKRIARVMAQQIDDECRAMFIPKTNEAFSNYGQITQPNVRPLFDMRS